MHSTFLNYSIKGILFLNRKLFGWDNTFHLQKLFLIRNKTHFIHINYFAVPMHLSHKNYLHRINRFLLVSCYAESNKNAYSHSRRTAKVNPGHPSGLCYNDPIFSSLLPILFSPIPSLPVHHNQFPTPFRNYQLVEYLFQ